MSYSTKRLQKLAGILKEEFLTLDSHQIKDLLIKYPAWLRAIHIWFHGAHHTTRGVGFAGDHTELYSRIYTEVQDEFDGSVEKIVGVTEDQELGCPLKIMVEALDIMQQYPSPSRLSAKRIAEIGLQIEKDYIKFVESLYTRLKALDVLTLGLDDQLMASSNTHETYVYLLKQRTRRSEEV